MPLLAACLVGCSIFDPPPDAKLPGDRLSPATVADLRVASSLRTSTSLVHVCFTWTAPGDDGFEGQAASYQFAYASDLAEMLLWSTDGIPPPSGRSFRSDVLVRGGAREARCFDLTLPADQMPFFFALRTRDGVDNISAVSNLVTIREANGPAAAHGGGPATSRAGRSPS